MNEATVIQAIMDQYNIPRDVAAAVAKEAVARADSRKKLKSVLMDRRKVGYYDWLQSEDSEPEMNWNYHYVKHICKYIQAMIDGDLYQVIFNLPPRLGKTSLITKRLPVYWMERNPSDGILLGAYSIELAINFSNFSRKLYAARNPGEVYSEAQREWTNVHGGFLKPVGVGVGVTGRGGELCIIDDPVKSIEEALSKAYMDRLWDWWTYDMKTRRNKMDKTTTAIVMCVAGGERILMGNGTWKAIEEVCAGDTVASFDKKNGIVKSTVLDSRCSGEDDLIKVKSGRSSLLVNKRHPFLVLSGGNRSAENSYRTVLSYEWRMAGDLVSGDRIVTCKSFSNENPVSVIPGTNTQITAEFMWLFGFLMGDGWATARKKKNGIGRSGYVCCAMGTDENLNQKVTNLMEKHFGGKASRTRFGYVRQDNASSAELLVSLGLTGGAKGKRVLEWVFMLSPENKRAFIDGVIDSDGCKDKRGIAFTVASANPKFLEDLKMLSLTCGIRPTNVHVFKDTTARAPNTKVPRETVFSSIRLSHTENDREGGSFVYKKDEFPYTDVRFERVVEVSREGRSLVYDLSVENENFIAEGFVVHNTRWTDEDLTGRIMNSAGAKDWTLVSIPAIAEEDDPLGRAVGESISPARMPIDSLHAYMEEDPVMFSGLFQQKTIQLSSASIKVDKLSFVDEVPLAAHRVRAWDMAATKGAGDFTVGLLMAVDDEGFVYVEDIVRGQYDEEDIGPLIKLTAELDWQMYGNSDTYIMQTWLEQEPGSSGKIVVNSFIRDELQGFDAYAERPSTNKTARARPFVAQVNAGNVRLKRAPWNAAYINELKVIVLGIDNKRDDQMDGSSEAYTKLVTERKRLTVA